jgi:hypothetical protein
VIEKNTSNNIQNRVPHVMAFNIIELLLRIQNEIGNVKEKPTFYTTIKM